MKRKKFRLTKEEMTQIKSAVKEAEMKTSGEIVPFIVAQSDEYWWVHGIWAGLGWVIVTTIVYCLSFRTDEVLPIANLFFYQSAGVLFGLSIALLPAVKRITIPKAVRAHNVHREVMASFVGAGLPETKHRTGVLLYLSVLERRVEILADKGIHDKLSNEYWQSHVDKIVKGIHAGTPVHVICEVISHIGGELAEAFPRHADDVNELSDEVHLSPED
jgi:putative membrane protein